jgi:predicted peptidase
MNQPAGLLFVSGLLLLIPGCATMRSEPDLPPGHHARAFTRAVTKTVGGGYLLFLPEDYGATRRVWPTILFLHGAGERGSDLDIVKRHGPPRIAEERPDFPFIVISPQCPENEFWSSDFLIGLLNEVEANYDVDRDRIYLTGMSMGGFGAWDLASRQPERFAAIAPICGGGNRLVACRLKDVPIRTFHGARDQVVPLARTEEMVQAVRDCGGNPELIVYPDAGHDAWTRTYDDPALYDWFMQHKRRK